MFECILPVHTRQNTQGSLPDQLQPQVSHAYPNRGMVTSASFMLPLTQGGTKRAVEYRAYGRLGLLVDRFPNLPGLFTFGASPPGLRLKRFLPCQRPQAS
jgi:hypothetical protein